MTQPYQWRADGARASEPDVPVRRPKSAADPISPVVPVPLVKPVPVPLTSPVATPKPIKAPVRQPQEHSPEVKQEAAAAIGAYNDLGPDYQDAVIESFLARLDQMNAARQRPPMMPVPMQPPMLPAKQKGSGSQTAMVITCVALAIPLTAIAGGMFGFIGLPITWVGIIVVALILGRGLGRD